jgi:glycosyltransferase involved in cell wall biosynthesis
VSSPEPLAINVIGDFGSSTGLAEAARRQIVGMLEQGVHIEVVPVDLDAPKAHNRIRPEIAALPLGRSGAIEIHYQNTNEFSRLTDEQVRPPGRRTYAIASWYWELPELPWDFMASVHRVDEIWVATEYVQHIFERTTDKPVIVVPAVVEGETSAAFDRRHFGLPQRPVLYFYSFDASSSYARKNPLGFVRAFARAFPAEQRGRDAALVLKAMRLDWFPELERLLRREVARVGGTLITDDLTNEEMTSLLHCADVYVSLHRSEGFGLGMAEAMRLGKPVISTAYSGSVDFATADNSLQVGYRLVAISDEDHRFHPAMTGLYRAGQLWADPDLDQAAYWMRMLLERPAERRRLGQAARRTILTDFSRQRAGQRARARLDQIVASFSDANLPPDLAGRAAAPSAVTPA